MVLTIPPLFFKLIVTLPSNLFIMHRLTALIYILIIPFLSHAQSFEEKAYREVIKSGPSTAPEILVITIKDLNTGIVKEVCTDITSLYWSLLKEFGTINDADIKKELLGHSVDRTFSFKNKESLERLRFHTYKLKNVSVIVQTIERNHLRDSLANVIKLREDLLKRYYEYVGKREKLQKEIADSISLKRPLTEEENRMIKNLRDQYYDEYYSSGEYDRYRQVSNNGKALMNIWNRKIKPYKTIYDDLAKNVDRANVKFFKNYYHKYGLNFCHIAFKYGIITYFGDENPEVGFSIVVK